MILHLTLVPVCLIWEETRCYKAFPLYWYDAAFARICIYTNTYQISQYFVANLEQTAAVVTRAGRPGHTFPRDKAHRIQKCDVCPVAIIQRAAAERKHSYRATTPWALISRGDIRSERNAARRRTRKGKSNEETYYNGGEERQSIVSVERKSEWEHCAPDGSTASRSRDVAPPSGSIPLLYNNPKRSTIAPAYIVWGTSRDDNCHTTDLWQTMAFYELPSGLSPREISTNPKES